MYYLRHLSFEPENGCYGRPGLGTNPTDLIKRRFVGLCDCF